MSIFFTEILKNSGNLSSQAHHVSSPTVATGLRHIPLQKTFEAFSTAEIISSPCHSLFYGSPFWYVGLTIGVLDQFFRVSHSLHLFSDGRHIPDENVENVVKSKDEDDK